MRLTVGFSTRDDRMAWMTINLLHELHGDVIDEFLIIDDSPERSEYAAQLEEHVRGLPHTRYVRVIGPESSCLYKDRLFRESTSDWTMCCDSHVYFEPGSIAALRAHLESHAGRHDLVTGPCFKRFDQMMGTNQMLYTHEPYALPDNVDAFHGVICRGGSLGAWVTDLRGLDVNGPAFEIQQQGTGAFCCHTKSWVGFHPSFVGHGGNETYLMERVRQEGGRVMCLPALRWKHCFLRSKKDVPYRLTWDERCANYLTGFVALGRKDLYDAIVEHMTARCQRAIAKAVKVVPWVPR